MKTAYFVKYPRIGADLRRLHLVNRERPYAVVKQLILTAVDYENFITDMTADRQFLASGAGACGEGRVMRCLFIRRRGKTGGVLVVPEGERYVKWAAYVAE